MKQDHLLLLAAFLTAIIFQSCKDSSPTSASTQGSMIGFVHVYDTLMQSMSDQSGVRVSVPGTSIYAITDQSGRWQLTNLPPGTNRLFYSKPGYSNFEDFHITSYGVAYLCQLSNLYPDIVLRPFDDRNIAVFSSNVQVSQNISDKIMTAIYFSKTKNIDPLDAKTFLFTSAFISNTT